MDNEKSIEVFNTLIEINNDRIVGYETASKETDESDLISLFAALKETSTKCKAELIHEVNILGGKPMEGTTNSGKFYRIWMDFKAAITGKDRKSILNSCEYGEEQAVNTYKEAMTDGIDHLTVEHQKMLEAQLQLIKSDGNKVKQLQDLLVEDK
jgi:uncharacterized protein (TIGR02284 family)